ncbi:MAG: galactose oxidase-like domain-containing protein [Bryobacteraceae bacterium]
MPASSFLIESASGDFELIVPRAAGGLDHYYRANNQAGTPWVGPTIVMGSYEEVLGAAIVESNIAGDRNFFAVYLEQDCLTFDFGKRIITNVDIPPVWHGPTCLPHAEIASAPPAFVEGPPGTLHVMAPVTSGGLGYWKGRGLDAIDDSDKLHPPLITAWDQPSTFGSGAYEGVAMVLLADGTLEVVARVGDRLEAYSRDGASGQWSGPAPVGDGAAGIPCMVENPNGGGLELVTPLAEGGLGHWSRGAAWAGPVQFGGGKPDSVGLVKSSWGTFEMVTREGRNLAHYWRDGSGAAGTEWNGPFDFTPAIPDRTVAGECKVAFRAGLAAIHSAVLHTGELFVFGFDHTETDHHVMGPEIPMSALCGADDGPEANPVTPHVFCSGHTFLPDGKLVVAGGLENHIKVVSTFDPATRTWTRIAQMDRGRWYPTCVSLPGGRVLIIGGSIEPGGEPYPINNSLQMLHPEGLGGPTPIPLPFSRHFAAGEGFIDTYPLAYLLPNGRVLIHSRFATRFYDPFTDTWDATDLRTQWPHLRTYPGQGAGVLLALRPQEDYRARVMLIGGAGDDSNRLWYGVDANKTCEILDLGADDPQWRFTAPMARRRVMCDGVLLPTGQIVVVGGSAKGARLMAAHPVLDVEMFDPETEQWTTMAPMEVPRLYHATAMLAPDGRVMMGGKDGSLNSWPYHYPEHRIEFFSPPYLFQGQRPVIRTLPQSVTYGEEFTIGCQDGSMVGSVVMMRPGSVTHSVNMNQRLVEVELVSQAAKTVKVVAPRDHFVAPEGYWMVFLISEEGVPSVARFVKLS